MNMARSASGFATLVRPADEARGGVALDKITAVLSALILAVAAWPMLMSQPDETSATATTRPAGSSESMAPETLYAGYGGVTHTHASDVHFAKPGVTDLVAHDVQWIGRPFKSPIYYGLRAMHWPASGRIGGMLDFTHAKAISVREQSVRFTGTRNGKAADGTATIGDTFRHLEFSHGHNMLTLNGLLGLGSIAPAVRPYVGGGFGVSLPHTEVQFHDEAKRTYEYQITGPVGQVLAGLEFRLPRVSILLEYKLSLAPYWAPLSARDGRKGNAFIDYWEQISRWLRGEAPEAGMLRTNLITHHAIVAVGYRHTGAPPSAPH